MQGLSRRDEEEMDKTIRERRTDDIGRRDRGEEEEAEAGEGDAFFGIKTGAPKGEWRVPLTRDLVHLGFMVAV